MAGGASGRSCTPSRAAPCRWARSSPTPWRASSTWCSRASSVRPAIPSSRSAPSTRPDGVYVAEYAASAGATREYLDATIAAEMQTMRRRRAEYTPVRPPLDPAGRVAIVVDDGLATGATMIAALHALRARAPSRLICAVPVASREAVAKVRPCADEVVCLDVPEGLLRGGPVLPGFPAGRRCGGHRAIAHRRPDRPGSLNHGASPRA